MPGNPKERQHPRCESVFDGAPEALTHSFWAGPQRWPTPDERYGQFGADADLAMQIRKASRKILLVPSARVRHEGGGAYTSLERADFLLSRAVFLGKYLGFGAGLQARLAAVFGPLLSFRFGELKHTLGGRKIDGTQT